MGFEAHDDDRDGQVTGDRHRHSSVCARDGNTQQRTSRDEAGDESSEIGRVLGHIAAKRFRQNACPPQDGRLARPLHAPWPPAPPPSSETPRV